MNVNDYIKLNILSKLSGTVPSHQYNNIAHLDLSGFHLLDSASLEDYKLKILDEIVMRSKLLAEQILRIGYPYCENTLEDLQELQNLANELVNHQICYLDLSGNKAEFKKNNTYRVDCVWHEVPYMGLLSLHKKFGLPYGYSKGKYFIGYYDPRKAMATKLSLESYKRNIKKFEAYCSRIELPFPNDFEIVNELLFNVLSFS